MLFSAELWDHLKHADRYGIDGVTPKLNWKGVLARKDDVISRHTKGLDFLMKKNKITTFKGFGKLTGPAKDGIHTIEAKLADGKTETIKAKKVVLATGSDARMLPDYNPDSTILTDYLLDKTTRLVDKLLVYPERMRRNLEMTQGLVYSGQLLLDLAAAGMLREKAYKLVQGYAMRAWQDESDFRAAVENDAEIVASLGREGIARSFSLERQLRHVDQIFARVFG